jgi:hypothetical protein
MIEEEKKEKKEFGLNDAIRETRADFKDLGFTEFSMENSYVDGDFHSIILMFTKNFKKDRGKEMII